MKHNKVLFNVKRSALISSNHLIIWVLVAACLSNCKNDGRQMFGTSTNSIEETPKQHLTDLKIDSLLVFPLLGKRFYYFNQGFVFSPFEKNKVWCTPENGEAFELDLGSGKTSLFSDKFNHPFFKNPMRSSGIYPDAMDSNVCWFLNFHRGIFRFDRSSNKGQFFNISNGEAVVTASFSKNYVWIGTTKGLWFYTRNSEKFRAVEYSPEVWVRGIRVISEDKIYINESFQYDPTSNCWETLPEESKRPDPGSTELHTILGLPNVGDPYISASSPTEFWSCNNFYWFSNLKNQPLVNSYQPPFSGHVQSLLADSDHLYVLYPDTFLLVNKAYLSTNRAGDPHLFSKLDRLKALDDSLKLYESDPWPERKAKMAYLNALFPNETDPYIKEHLSQVSQFFKLPLQADSLLILLNTPNMDKELRDRAFDQLLKDYVRNGHLRKALDLYLNVENKQPDIGSVERYKSSIATLKTSLHQLDSIDQMEQNEYEREWAKGKAMEWFCTKQGFFQSEVCYNYWLADSIYKRMLRLYPTSPLADNAELRRIDFTICHEGEDGSNHPEEIVVWKRFLKKYPETELKAEVLCNMAWALGREKKDLYQGLRWVSEAEKLRPDLFLKDKKNNLSWIKESFQKDLDWLELDFKVRVKNTHFHTGDPVILEFSVQNMGMEPKRLNGYQDKRYPNFSLEIAPLENDPSCIRPVTYLESKTSAFGDETTVGSWQIAPGNTYKEAWDITKTAHKFNNPVLGSFVFDRPGTYKLKAHWRIWLEPKETEWINLVVD